MDLTPQLNELCDMCRGFAVDANMWTIVSAASYFTMYMIYSYQPKTIAIYLS